MRPRWIRASGALALLFWIAEIVLAVVAAGAAPSSRPYLLVGILFVLAAGLTLAWALGSLWWWAAAGAFTRRARESEPPPDASRPGGCSVCGRHAQFRCCAHDRLVCLACQSLHDQPSVCWYRLATAPQPAPPPEGR